jgi:hypothetical protein
MIKNWRKKDLKMELRREKRREKCWNKQLIRLLKT